MTNTVVNGLLLGSGYALLALGFALVFGVTRLLNLAHGVVFMVSAAVALLMADALDLPLAATIVVAVVVGGVAGLLVDLVCFRPVPRTSYLAPAVATIGVGLVIQNGLALARGGSSSSIVVPAMNRPGDLHFGSILVSVPQVAMFVLAIGLMMGLAWFLRSTRWGAALRGMAEDRETVEILGISTRRMGTAVLIFSGFLAGAAGILIAIRNGSINPYGGSLIGLTGLAIITVAGLGSLVGAVVVGLALGLIESLVGFYVGSELVPAIPWILVVLVLLVRPRGLFAGSRR